MEPNSNQKRLCTGYSLPKKIHSETNEKISNVQDHGDPEPAATTVIIHKYARRQLSHETHILFECIGESKS